MPQSFSKLMTRVCSQLLPAGLQRILTTPPPQFSSFLLLSVSRHGLLVVQVFLLLSYSFSLLLLLLTVWLRDSQPPLHLLPFLLLSVLPLRSSWLPLLSLRLLQQRVPLILILPSWARSFLVRVLVWTCALAFAGGRTSATAVCVSSYFSYQGSNACFARRNLRTVFCAA